MRNFVVVGRVKTRKTYTIIVALVHDVHKILQICFRRVFTASVDKTHAVSFTKDVKKLLFCLENSIRRIEGFARGYDVADGRNFPAEVDVVE